MLEVGMEEKSVVSATSAKDGFWRRLARDPAAIASGSVVVAILLVSVLVPLFGLHDPTVLFPNGISAQGGPLGPTREFPLGTDQFGHDELSRLLWGGRSAILVSVTSSAMAAVIGLVLGGFAGLSGGWVDTLIARFTNILMSFPLTLFAVAMVMVLKPSLLNLIVVMSCIYWTYTA
ncbi:MAG: hypothetical protein K6T30_01230, partial [Alicyclobacillus sp.]|nr:hypothetical protein [Alicyclobacillus sp.]